MKLRRESVENGVKDSFFKTTILQPVFQQGVVEDADLSIGGAVRGRKRSSSAAPPVDKSCSTSDCSVFFDSHISLNFAGGIFSRFFTLI